MEFEKINKLLEKYWNGETSLEEEQVLKDYFQQEVVHEEHQKNRALFQFFQNEKNHTLSSDFEEQLIQQLSNNDEKIRKLPSRKSSRRFFLPRIAAAIVLLFSMWFFFQKPSSPTLAEIDQQEIEEAKIAYKQAKAALLLLSSKLNEGTNAAVSGLQQLDKATNIVKGKRNRIKHH